jgi:hypothetical protein
LNVVKEEIMPPLASVANLKVVLCLNAGVSGMIEPGRCWSLWDDSSFFTTDSLSFLFFLPLMKFLSAHKDRRTLAGKP